MSEHEPARSVRVLSKLDAVIEFSPDDWTRYIPLAHLLEGEVQKSIAVGEAINGEINLYAGGITWTDADYDERMGDRPRSLKWQPHSPEQNARARLEQMGGDDISQAWVLSPSDVLNEATELENRMLKRLVEAVHAGRCSVKGRVGPDLHLIKIPADLITPERLLPLGSDSLKLGDSLYIGVRVEELCPQTEIARCRPAIETMGSNNGALETAIKTRRNRTRRTALETAIKTRPEASEQPGVTVQWRQFCDDVRDDADGWADRKQGKVKWGYSAKTINRIVKEQRQRPDKQDKQDNTQDN
jgi:hypothetical protein